MNRKFSSYFIHFMFFLICSGLLTACQKDDQAPVFEVGSKHGISEISYYNAVAWMHPKVIHSSIRYAVCFTSDSEEPRTVYLESTPSDSLYSAYLYDLSPNTTYTYWFMTQSSMDEFLLCSDTYTFQTKSNTEPIVETGIVRTILPREAICVGYISDLGGLPLLNKGICYSMNHSEPNMLDSVVYYEGGEVGGFDCLLSSLLPNHTYYFRVFASNTMGTSYGKINSFTTLGNDLPQVTTISANAMSDTKALCQGLFAVPEKLEPYICGFCYATTPEPTVLDMAVSSIPIGSPFTATLNNLSPDTHYYVRAFATNYNGTSYGEQLEFTTLHK